VHSKLFPYIAP